jgi:hypothetical protein
MIPLHFLYHQEGIICGMDDMHRRCHSHRSYHAPESTKPAVGNRKRSIERPSETLGSLLEGVRVSLLRVREHCHHFILASSGITEWFIDEGANSTMQNSILHFMQCCLYMYNAMEEGLDYLDDPSTSIQCVQKTLHEVDIVNALVTSSSPVMVNGSSLQMLCDPLNMLHSTLLVMQQEMEDPAGQGSYWQRRVLEFGDNVHMPRARIDRQ